MSKLISSLTRKINRRRTIESILARRQNNENVVFLHRIDKTNAGDYFCSPGRYFEELPGTALDLLDYQHSSAEVRERFCDLVSNAALVIGGGGLLNRGSFEKQMRLFARLADRGKKTVLWGVGHNARYRGGARIPERYNIDLGRFGLVGTRDYSMSSEYVPCVSCMHRVFDALYEETRDIGIVFHKRTLGIHTVTARFREYPTCSNSADLETLVEFIGSCRAIVTDSYHAMYWSMLLGKGVTVVPGSSKFFDFKYQPRISTFDECLALAGDAPRYSGLLEECRESNRNYHLKVMDYLS